MGPAASIDHPACSPTSRSSSPCIRGGIRPPPPCTALRLQASLRQALSSSLFHYIVCFSFSQAADMQIYGQMSSTPGLGPVLLTLGNLWKMNFGLRFICGIFSSLLLAPFRRAELRPGFAFFLLSPLPPLLSPVQMFEGLSTSSPVYSWPFPSSDPHRY